MKNTVVSLIFLAFLLLPRSYAQTVTLSWTGPSGPLLWTGPLSGTGALSAPVIPSHAWTASNKPYQEAEDQIRKEYAGGKSLQSIAEEYRVVAKAKPKDPVAQFAWVCVERGAALAANPEKPLPPELLYTLTKADPGNVWFYTRYRFCITEEMNLALSLKNAKQIGGRLLAAYPKDDWVRLSLINMMSSVPAGSEAALPYARDWIRMQPNDPKAHSSLAETYFDLWGVGKHRNAVLGRKAISEFQIYLHLAPTNDIFRRHAQSFIKYIQQEQILQG